MEWISYRFVKFFIICLNLKVVYEQSLIVAAAEEAKPRETSWRGSWDEKGEPARNTARSPTHAAFRISEKMTGPIIMTQSSVGDDQAQSWGPGILICDFFFLEAF